jgi:hypothetical protein
MPELVVAHRTARGYEHRIDRTLALILDFTHLAVAWWAGPLPYLGIGEWELALDCALSYPDAQRELRPREAG